MDFLSSDIARKSGMENDKTIILVSKWSWIHVEYIISKISFWAEYDISLIYSCWVTYDIPKCTCLDRNQQDRV